jgi:signal transduction histidine kinase
MGLGLFIARAIMTAHRGRIWVESRPGQGARFCLSFPRPVSAAPPPPPRA